jgi:hypothetical protein
LDSVCIVLPEQQFPATTLHSAERHTHFSRKSLSRSIQLEPDAKLSGRTRCEVACRMYIQSPFADPFKTVQPAGVGSSLLLSDLFATFRQSTSYDASELSFGKDDCRQHS